MSLCSHGVCCLFFKLFSCLSFRSILLYFSCSLVSDIYQSINLSIYVNSLLLSFYVCVWGVRRVISYCPAFIYCVCQNHGLLSLVLMILLLLLLLYSVYVCIYSAVIYIYIHKYILLIILMVLATVHQNICVYVVCMLVFSLLLF